MRKYEHDHSSGIYAIVNIVNCKMYIGYTKDFASRWWGHKSDLRNNKNKNSHLQGAWNKYGENNFLFEIIEKCDKTKLIEKEHYWATVLRTHDNEYGYNLKPTNVVGNPGHSPETIEKIRRGNSKPNPKLARSIIQFSINGEYIKEWESITTACIALKLHTSPVINACKGTKFSSGGFVWRYKNDYNGEIVIKKPKTARSIKRIGPDNIELTFDNITEAAIATDTKTENIRSSIWHKGKCKGYRFEFIEDRKTLYSCNNPFPKHPVQ